MEFSDTQFNSLYYIIAANCQSYTIPHCASVLSACSQGIVSVTSVALGSVWLSGGRCCENVREVSFEICFTWLHVQYILMSLHAIPENSHEHNSWQHEATIFVVFVDCFFLIYCGGKGALLFLQDELTRNRCIMLCYLASSSCSDPPGGCETPDRSQQWEKYHQGLYHWVANT